MNNVDYPRKVKYWEYVLGFNADILKSFVEDKLLSFEDFDTERMRGLIYGYTFTKDYAKGIIPDTFSMDYWRQKDPVYFPKGVIERIPLSLSQYIGHGGRIYEAIKSTGDGTINNPYCVICVGHEYEFLKRMYKFPLEIVKQYLLPGYIDCIEFVGEDYSQNIYFDISRWFKKVKAK